MELTEDNVGTYGGKYWYLQRIMVLLTKDNVATYGGQCRY